MLDGQHRLLGYKRAFVSERTDHGHAPTVDAGKRILAWGGPFQGTENRWIRTVDSLQERTVRTPAFPEFVSGTVKRFRAVGARFRRWTGSYRLTTHTAAAGSSPPLLEARQTPTPRNVIFTGHISGGQLIKPGLSRRNWRYSFKEGRFRPGEPLAH